MSKAYIYTLIFFVIYLSTQYLQDISTEVFIANMWQQIVCRITPIEKPLNPLQSLKQNCEVYSGDNLLVVFKTLYDQKLSANTSTQAAQTDSGKKALKSTDKSMNDLKSYPLNSVLNWNEAIQQRFLTIRQKLVLSYLYLLPQPHAGMVIAVTLGDKQWLSNSRYPMLENTGTQHLLATSGFHLSLLLSLVASAHSFLKVKLRPWILWLFALLFLLLVGFKVSLIRAFLMLSLSLIARYWANRQYSAMYALIIAANIVLIFDSSLIQNVSFQLSFGATFSILLYANQLSRIFKLSDATKVLIDSSSLGNSVNLAANFSEYLLKLFLVGISAQIVATPLVLVYFDQAPLFSFIPSAVLSLIMPVFLGTELIVGVLFVPILEYIPLRFLHLISQVLMWIPAEFYIQILAALSNISWYLIDASHLSSRHYLGWFCFMFVFHWLLQQFQTKSRPHLKSTLRC